MGNQLGLRDKNKFALLWIVDFPMFEWSEEEGRLMAMHHPFTHPKDEDIPLLDTNPAAVRADAYDMVCNGIEVGGGSIRIHDAQLQAKMFEILGFTPEKAEEQFGFLMNAFKFGAPPHGGLAYGLDRWVSILQALTVFVIASHFRRITPAEMLCWTHPRLSIRNSWMNSTLLLR